MKNILVILAVSAPALALGQEPSTEARALYERAAERFRDRSAAGLGESLELFHRAAELDPGLSRAHAGEADAACLLALYGHRAPLEVMPRARKAAEAALALDPELAEAHAALGLTRYLHDWDWEAAESSFERAVAHDPSYSEVRHWYAMMLMATGRYDAAVEQIDAAIRIAPERALYAVKRGTILIAASRYDEAEAQLAGAVERHPDYQTAHRELGRLALARGQDALALEALERAAALPGGRSATTQSTLALSLGRLGETERARAIQRDLEDRARSGYLSRVSLAVARLGAGDREGALEALDEAVEARDAALVYIGVQPALAGLRSEPRFVALVERLGLALKRDEGTPGVGGPPTTRTRSYR